MANRVNTSPSLPRPSYLQSFTGVQQFAIDLVLRTETELRDHANRLNLAAMKDGTEVQTAPLRLKVYLKTALPSAVTYAGGLIAVSNEVGGYTVAFSDGTNWRRTSDRAIVS